MKKLKIEDMYRMKVTGDPQLKNGKIAFVAGQMNKKENDYLSKIYVYDGKIREFTSGKKDSSPRFSPDGNFIAFLSSNEKKTDIKIISLKGGEAKKIGEVKYGVQDLKWDGNYLYFISPLVKEEKDVKHVDRIPFYFNGKGFIYNARSHLFRINVKNGKIEKLTDGEFNVVAYDVRDGIIAYARSEDEVEPYMHTLYIKDLKGERKISVRKASISEIRISPDKKRIALFLKFREKSFAEHSKLYFIPIEGGDYKKACDIDLGYGNSLNSDMRFFSGNDFQWIDNNSIMFVVSKGGYAPIYIYHDGKCDEYLGNVSIEGFYYENGSLAFVSQDFFDPPTLYLMKGDKIRRITKFNRFIKNVDLGELKDFRFTASDGVGIDGWILVPKGKRKYPAILEIHGGPKTSYGSSFMFEFHYFNSLGFAVIFMNPRGSAGYDEKFAMEIQGHYGERDYKDLIEGLEFILKNYPIDRDKIFVTGGSYGGFMTNWIVGHTTLFKAAATQRSISNQLSFWGTSDIGPWFNNDQIGKGRDLWDATMHYWDKSPLKYAKNIKTPLLIIHSEEDYRCPIEQAYQLFYALKMQRKETKMVIFPKENHDLSRSGKPKHREERLKAIGEWFIEHMK